ncbi:MAG: restriction endonuclease subunit S [Epsilonproteobacteria bacterium]|nr:restriction endonuclease subunit S [Campylobacterota bacterium]
MKEKIKFLFSEKKKESNPNLRSGAISFGKVIYKDDEKVPFETKKSYQVVNKGEFLINPLNLNYDLKSLRIALSEIDVVVSQGYIVLQLKKEDASRIYLSYLLHIFDILFMKSLGAGVRQTISFNDLANCFLPLPPKQEQIQIADYLDKKTAQIDKAVTLKERLIALLKEQRQILINRAVTQGLDPNVPMKESGVEWIGKIPAHWEVRKFRFLFDFAKGLNITKENLQKEGIPCVNYGEIHSKYGFEVIPERDSLKCVDTSYLKTNPKSLLKSGDFVFADTSEDVEAAGSFTYLNSDTPTFAGYHTIIARAKTPIFNRFMAYFFSSDAFKDQVRSSVRGVKVYSITNAILKDTRVCLPQREEQEKIVEFLDRKISDIDRLIALQKQGIEKLKEYRESLIDAVVTGKVKKVK